MRHPGALQNDVHRAVANLAIGRVAPRAERVDHRILEMGAPPPGDELPRIDIDVALREERGRDLGQSGLHIDDGAVLIE